MPENTSRLIVDVPSVTLTAQADLDTLVSRASERWRSQPAALVYPTTWAGGLATATDTLFGDTSPLPGQSLDEAVKFCGANGLDLWLDVNLALPQVRSDLVHVKDFYGGSALHACINSPAAQSALSLILQEIAPVVGRVKESPLRGVVFSLQDLWPLAGEDVIELHCFCESCRAFLDESEHNLLSHFQGTPNPWDIGLADTGTGVDHITTIDSHITPEQLLRMSLVKGFYPAKLRKDGDTDISSDPVLVQWAEYLIKYITIRHDLTTAALKRIGNLTRDALGDDVIIAGVVSDEQYDWLSGLFLDRLDKEPPVDQFWIDPTNSGTPFKSAPFHYYLWERSRYYVSQFFELLEAMLAGTYVNEQLNQPRARRAALRYAELAQGKMMSAPIALRVLTFPSNAQPDVVVLPLRRNSMLELVDDLIPSANGEQDGALDLLNRLRTQVTGERD